MQVKSKTRDNAASVGQFNYALESRPETSVAVDQSAVEASKYIMDVASQLEKMAVAARLDFLAYFLRLAEFEARSISRDRQRDSRTVG
jgi:hypothetical protein